MKKKVYCIACECQNKLVEATEEVDGAPLCKRHAAIYRGKFDNLIKK